jgi:regulator of sigma E protease
MTVVTVPTLYHDLLDRGIIFSASRAPGPAIGQSFQWSWSIVKVTVRSIGMMFSGAIRPQDTLSGPVGVVSMISDVVSQEQPLSEKIYQLLWMFALISVSLGFMNLLPIPPLDGNHLLLIGIEAIRGRRLPVRVQNLIGMLGIALIIMLALAGLLFDIMRLTGQ